MRIGYALALTAFLAATPAMAQLTITTGNGDSAQHAANADQDRAAGRQNMYDAHREADMGNYGAAARDQQAAHEDWHAARDQQYQANRDRSGVTVEVGH